MNLEIKKMEFADYEQIEENLCKDFDDFWTKESLKQELENKNKLDSHYIVAKQNKEVVGFAGAINIIDEFNIMNIVVKKDKRNMKIGSNLLEEIIKIANKIKCKTITLEVNENNLNAIKLYKKYGFKQIGLRKKYYNNKDNAIIMNLDISLDKI